jgi:predicted neuraminidase
MTHLLLLFLALCGAENPTADVASPTSSEFVFSEPPFRSCHASTLIDAPSGDLLCAWFAGDAEGRTNVSIWIARKGPTGWSPPLELVTGLETDGQRYPCWNPVLTRTPSGRIDLYYKVGPKPDRWWGRVLRSSDSGQTWSASERLPDHVLGPIKNKPEWLPNGDLLAPSSVESPTTDVWQVRMERLDSITGQWSTTGPLADPLATYPIQPSILKHPEGKLQILCRSRCGVIVQSWSTDLGQTWSPIEKTAFPNPNSGTDAVTLRSGRHLLLYNPTTKGRTPLVLAVSSDGLAWKNVATLESEPGEYSYPAIIEGADGRVHLSYTWKRLRVKQVTFPPNLTR